MIEWLMSVHQVDVRGWMLFVLAVLLVYLLLTALYALGEEGRRHEATSELSAMFHRGSDELFKERDELRALCELLELKNEVLKIQLSACESMREEK